MNEVTVFDITYIDEPIESIVSVIFSGNCSNKIIVTPNVDHINRYHRCKKFKSIYKKADIYLNDSKVIKRLSSLLPVNLQYTNPGSDLTRLMFESDYIQGKNICAIGASKEDVEIIKRIYSINHIYHIEPSYGFIQNEREVNEIIHRAKSFPECIYFVAVGSPQQEDLAVKMKAQGVKGIFICCGASLLFLSGSERRAPKILQKYSLEWFYRLLKSPKRLFRRYVIDGPYIFVILFKYLKK